ncbi:MAG: hypothetical protein LBM76_00845 [Mycoplasmataceae bacterium]|nr:hypothetical protein [Mycoplasmataceae bacterium]
MSIEEKNSYSGGFSGVWMAILGITMLTDVIGGVIAKCVASSSGSSETTTKTSGSYMSGSGMGTLRISPIAGRTSWFMPL